MENLTQFFLYGPGGNIASVVGLVISIIGFGVTIWNTWRAKNAAQKTEQAILQVREDIRRIDSVSELTEAISIMTEIKRLHRTAAWGMLPDRYTALRKLLVSIRTTYPNLSEEQQASFVGATLHFATMENEVEKALDKKALPSSVPKLNEIVSKQIDKLVEILVEIRNNIGVQI